MRRPLARRSNGDEVLPRLKRALRLLLALLSPLMLSVAIPFVNRVEPRVAGLPFLLAWILIWIALSPVFYWAIYKTENR